MHAWYLLTAGSEAPAHLFSVSKHSMPLMSSPRRAEGLPPFSAIKIHKKMESFICKTNNAEEIKHSGELSGPFKNQYKAFHLRPNLFLVIILHILCSLPCLLTHKLITYRTLSHTQILRHNLRGLFCASTFITHNHSVGNFKKYINFC